MKFLQALGELLGLARKASADDAADDDAQRRAKEAAGRVEADATAVSALILRRMRSPCIPCRGAGYIDGAICARCVGSGKEPAGSR